MPGVIDSFLVSLGVQTDTRGISEMKAKVDSAKESLLSFGDVIVGFIGVEAIRKVVDLGSEFESTRIAIAGLFSATGASSNFNAGLDRASETMEYIEKISATLPGRAEEYIDVFKTGFPFVREAMPAASTEQVADFTAKFTAIGKTMKAGSDEIGIMLTRLLAAGHATLVARSPFTQQLLVSMRQVSGYAHLTVEQFNKLTQPQRLALLQQTFEKLDPMVKAFSNSWEAMWGTMRTNIAKVVRTGTAGLFGQLKIGIDQLNGMVFKADGTMTEFGKNTVAGIASIAHVMSTLLVDGMQFVAWLGKLEHGGLMAKIAFGAFGVILSGLALEKTIVKVGALAKGLDSIKTILSGFLLTAFFLIGEDIWGFYHGANSVTGVLVNKLGPGIAVVATAVGSLAVAFAALKVQALAAGVGMAIGLWPITIAIVGMTALGVAIYELGKHWDAISARFNRGLNRIIDGFNMFLDVVNKVIEAFGSKGFAHVGHVDLDTSVNMPDALKGFTGGDKPFRKLSDATGDARPSWLTPNPKNANRTNGPVTVHHGDIHIHTPTTDPHEHGEIVRRVMRTNAKGYVR